MQKTTIVHYQYRDGSNYKASGVASFAGAASEAQKLRLVAALADLDGDRFFIPGQVGLLDLQDSFGVESCWDPDEDHPWHSIEEIVTGLGEPSDPRDIETFIQACEGAAWDPGYLPPFHDAMAERHDARLAGDDFGC